MRPSARVSAVSRRGVLALAAALFAATGFGALADDAKDDAQKKIQGTWVSDRDGHDSKWSFDKDAFKASVGDRDYAGKITLDPKGEPFATMDVAISEGPDDSAGKSSKGIYKFDGDRLVICVTLPGASERPKEFKDVDGECFVFDLKKGK